MSATLSPPCFGSFRRWRDAACLATRSDPACLIYEHGGQKVRLAGVLQPL